VQDAIVTHEGFGTHLDWLRGWAIIGAPSSL
jgi:hypothetical protein